MKFNLLVAVAFAALFSSGVEAVNKCKPSRDQAKSKTCQQAKHIVKNGDICLNIASHHAMTLDELMKQNPGIVCDKLSIGQTVCVLDFKCEKNTHVVVQGDTCYEISKKHGLTLEELKKKNPKADCSNLQIEWPICY